jgi:hypothetical protein
MPPKNKKNSQNTLPPNKKQKLEGTTHKEVELTKDILEAVSSIYVKLTLDFTFKKLFGNDHNKALTINFLNSIFDFTGHEAIRKISFENTFYKRSAEEKMSILDVFCTDEKGRRFIIEVQQQKLVAFEKRV